MSNTKKKVKKEKTRVDQEVPLAPKNEAPVEAALNSKTQERASVEDASQADSLQVDSLQAKNDTVDMGDTDDEAGGEEIQEQDEEAALGKLTLLLEDARSKADDHWDQCLRLKADIENLHRRHERELEKAHKFALDNFALELLPVVDSLELGLNAAGESNADVATTDATVNVTRVLTEGSVMTLKLLKTALGKFGIKEINPIGEAFNPEIHQAMAMQESDKVSPNTVLTVYQKGYLLNERVVRPAMVVVAKEAQSDATDVENKDIKGSEEEGSLGTQIDEQA